MSAAYNSPDGSKAVVRWNRQPSRQPRGIWAISIDGSSESFIQGDADGEPLLWPVAWSGDGNWFYVQWTDKPGRILKIPSAGGKPQTVVNLPFDHIGQLSMSPDGKVFVFTVIETKRDVWLVEDFDGSH